MYDSIIIVCRMYDNFHNDDYGRAASKSKKKTKFENQNFGGMSGKFWRERETVIW